SEFSFLVTFALGKECRFAVLEHEFDQWLAHPRKVQSTQFLYLWATDHRQ
ncbi:hypothetical protein TNCV_1354341, partial [Trichonephila clavipes]